MHESPRAHRTLRTTLFAAALALSAIGGTACMHGEPDTYVSDLDPECAGTEVGRACMILQFSATPLVLQHAPSTMKGTLRWAVYNGGDVDLLGPGDHPSLYEGDIEGADLTQPEGTYRVVLTNVPAQAYQSLAYLDKNGDGHSDSGDPVTFPSDPFRIPSNKATEVQVHLDYLR